METFQKLLVLRKCHPVILFWEAINYQEERMAEQSLGKLFISCCEPEEDGSVRLVTIPEFVESYCLDVLAERAKPMKYGGKSLDEHVG